jgi:hypothetical protein
VTLYFIETKCFTSEDHSLFLGTPEQLRARLDELSTRGWMIAAGFEVATGLATPSRTQ